MRVVFDSNIFISALVFRGGQAAKALGRIIDGVDRLVISREIIREVAAVLGRKFDADAEEMSRVALFLSDLGEMVEPGRRLAVLRDEPDNRILECAEAGHAERIVTGDRAMLALGRHGEVRIVSLAAYLTGQR
jgi:putative PIN family toxin of toxin-antitoxin system